MAERLEHQLQDDLRAMSTEEEREAREEGEHLWLGRTEQLDHDGLLPYVRPGLHPNWNLIFQRNIPDYSELTYHYKDTHHLGVVYKDAEIESITFHDLATLAQGTVPETTLHEAMSSHKNRKSFIKAILKALEWNGIFIPPHTSVKWLIKSIKGKTMDYSESLLEAQTDSANTYSLYLVNYDTEKRFYVDDNPTEVKYGICQGCKDLMPVKAPCSHAINVDWRNRYVINACAAKGPYTELYLPFETRKVLTQLECQTEFPEAAIDLIAQYATPANEQMDIEDSYDGYVGIQLDARAYDQKERIVKKPFEQFVKRLCMTDNENFCTGTYQRAREATFYPAKVTESEIQSWIDAEMNKDNRTFSLVGPDDLERARDEFIQECQEDDAAAQQQNPDEGNEEEEENEEEEDDDEEGAW